MKKLAYDPADGLHFWEAIRKLPGFPVEETTDAQTIHYGRSADLNQMGP